MEFETIIIKIRKYKKLLFCIDEINLVSDVFNSELDEFPLSRGTAYQTRSLTASVCYFTNQYFQLS